MKRHLVRALAALLALGPLSPSTRAASHKEAPLISMDPTADNTDTYAFVSPDDPTTVTLIANVIPLQTPQQGPTWIQFDPNVLYEIHVDNNADALEDVTFQFRFQNQIRNANTFLYNTGPVTSLDDPDLNVVETFSVTRVEGSRRSGTAQALASGLRTAPNRVGINSFPDYEPVARQAIHRIANGIRVFAGPREEAFYLDLGRAFDLLQVTTGTPVDYTAGLNVHTIAISVPIDQLTRNRTRPTSPADAAAVIGVWASNSRRAVSVRTPGERPEERGEWVQVSRLGMPLVNEAVIARAMKDRFNASEPRDDAQFASFVTDPEPARLLNLLFGIRIPPPPRNDLVQVYLTGLPGLNQPAGGRPAEMLRLNVAIPPNQVNPNPLGVIAGDLAGFPNGRRVCDDITDVTLTAASGALVPGFGAMLTDRINANDAPCPLFFPFQADPFPGTR